MFTQPTEPRFDIAEYRARDAENVWRHHQSTGAGVILPLLQSGASALVIGFALAVVSWAAGWGNPLKAGAVGAALVLAVSWLALLSNWLGVIATLESVFKMDINGDGRIGEDPEPEPPAVVRVELKSEDGRHTQFADIPSSPEKLSDLARGIIAGQPFSENTWSGAGALFSRAEFREIRDAFISRGWLRWKDDRYPTQGTELSPAGRAVLRQFASFSAGDSPTLRARRR